MLSSDAFENLLVRIQAGDDDAAAELIESCESEIRRIVRVRMRVQDGRVRRLLDSMDITQSVLASFFAGVTAGRIAPANSQQLLATLVTMARNKLLTQVRNQRRQKRDMRRLQSLDVSANDVPGVDESPSTIVSGRELLSEFRRRLSEDERLLSERRARGEPWSTIAAELGGTAEGRRKQLERAFERIAQELHLDDEPSRAPGRAP